MNRKLELSPGKEKYIICLMLSLLPLFGFGIDIYTPSLPIITHYFNTTHTLGKLTISIYIFSYGLGQLFIGPLSERFGRRIFLLGSLVVFGLSSFFATISPSIGVFLLMRLIQGLANAGMILCIRAIAVDLFKGNKLRKVLIYITTVWTLSPIIGPGLGGYLQTYIGWRAGFYLLAIWTIPLLILLLVSLPETNLNLTKHKFRSIIKNYTLVSSNWSFMKNVVAIALGYAMLNIFTIIGPFVIQVQLHHSPLFYGHLAILIGIFCFIGSISNRYFMRYFTINKTILLSLLWLLTVSFISLIGALWVGLSVLMVVIPTLLTTMALGTLVPNYGANCSNQFKEMAGTAAATRGSVSMVGTSLLTAIFSLLHVHHILTYLSLYLVLAVLMMGVFFIKKKQPTNGKKY